MVPTKIRAITDPKKAKVLASETRLKILQEIAETPQSISQLAKKLSITPVAVHYHIKKLVAAGFIKLSKQEVVNNNLTEKFYEATTQEYLVVVSGELPTKGPVPAKKPTEKLLLGITANDVQKMLELLGLTCLPSDKEFVEKEVLKFLETAVREAGAVQKDLLAQLNLKLSMVDRSKLEYAAMAVFAIVVDRILDQPENQEKLQKLVKLLRKSDAQK
ncbi:MAG: ArsR/SmtB family transcription factor [Candidatus Bathyarchaeia archaeon]